MGTGYVRNDTANNIADGNIINASDLDGEYDAIQSAFDASTGHTHDGTAGEGAPIETIGPSQDVVATASVLRPKTDNTVDLGTTSLEYKDLFLDGTAHIDTLDVDENASITGTLGVTGTTTLGTANITTGTITTADINGGNIDGTIIGATTAAAITGTTITGTSFVTSGDMTFGDNDRAIFGAGSDLQIFHDAGGTSHIRESGSDNLYIEATNLRLKSSADTGETYLTANVDGAVSLYYDNAVKLATTSTGVDITGVITADDYIQVTGSPSPYIELVDTDNNVTTRLQSLNTSATVGTESDHDLYIQRNNTNIVSVLSTGVDVTGTITSDGLTVETQTGITLQDAGDTRTAKLFFDSGAFQQQATGSGDIHFYTTDSKTLRLAITGNTGDISFYEDTGTTAKFFWSAADERLGIGTASPATPLHVKTDGSGYALTLEENSGGEAYQLGIDAFGGLVIYNSGTKIADFADSSEFQMYDGGAVKAKISPTSDSYFNGGSVGIGTSSPSRKLSIYDATAPTLNLQNSTSGTGSSDGFMIFTLGSDATLVNYEAGFLALSTSGTERMRIDTSGNVGIGTDSPQEQLHIHGGASATRLRISGGGLNNTYGGFVEGEGVSGSGGRLRLGVVDNSTDRVGIEMLAQLNSIVFNTGSSETEAMRIDSSGNLLVGTTAVPTDDNTALGFGVTSSGEVRASVNGANAAMFKRATSYGDIVEFRKDATTVGSIGIQSSGFIIDGEASHTGLRFTSAGITPRLNKAESDNAVNLGESGVRFKDLYLSGGVYLGGTGSANKLDDYEEGTWTPAIADAASAGNTSPTSATAATYTKVGNLVTVQMNIQNIDTTGMTGANDIYITGLPFTVKSISGSSYFTGSLMSATLTFTGNISVVAEDNFSYVNIAETTSGGSVDLVTVGEISSGATDLWFSLTYMTT